jgi:hypothetical protein
VMADVAAVVAAAAGSRGIGIGGNLVSLGCGVVWCGVVWPGWEGRDPVVSRVHVLGGRWGGTGEEWFENSTFSSWSLPPPPPPPHPQPGIIRCRPFVSVSSIFFFTLSRTRACLLIGRRTSPPPSVLIHTRDQPASHNSRGDYPAT